MKYILTLALILAATTIGYAGPGSLNQALSQMFGDQIQSGHLQTRSYKGAISTITDADLSFDDGAVQVFSISDDEAFTVTALSSSHARVSKIKISTDASPRNVTFPNEWLWIGSKPTSLAASTSAYLYLSSDGPSQTDVVACWVVLEEGE